MLAARITSMDDITSWQQVKEKTRRRQSQQHTPLHVIPPPPPPPLPNTVPCNSRVRNPASVWVYGSSMARGVAAHLNKYDGVNATGSVRGGATVERLTSEMEKRQPDHGATHVVLLAGTNNIANGDSLSHIRDKTRGLLQATKSAFPVATLILSGIHHRVDLPQPATNVSIDKLNSDLQVLCQQLRVVFVDNNTESAYQMPDTYRLSNRDGLHLNTPGRKVLSDRLVNVIIPSRQSVAPSATRCRPVPQHQQVQHSKTAPQPIPRKQRPQQHPPRERPLQPPPRQRTQHVSSQQRTTVTSKKWNHKMNALNQHSSQPVLNHPKKDRQLPRRFKQAKEFIVNSRLNPRPVQQPGRFAKQKRDQPRRVEASSQSSPHQRRPDTHSQETYASVVSDSRHPQCMYPAPFPQNRLLMRDKMSAWTVQPLQMIASQQNNIVSVHALLAAALQQAGMTQTIW